MNKKEYQCKYNKNDLVYAKIRGYPWWPGIIGEIKLKPGENGEKKYELLVNFIGDHSHSMVNEDKLQKFHVKEIDFKNKKRKKLMQSIQIANDIFQGKFTYEEWRNKDRKKSIQQKKAKQPNGKEKKQFNDSGSEEGNSSDDQRDSDAEDDEEYGPTTSAKLAPSGGPSGIPQLQTTLSQQSKQNDNTKKNTKKTAGKSTSTSNGNGHFNHEMEEEEVPQKNSKLKNKRKNNKVIEDSEEEKMKGLYFQNHNISDMNHQAPYTGFQSISTSKGSISHQNGTMSSAPSTASSSNSSYSNQQGGNNSTNNASAVNGNAGTKSSSLTFLSQPSNNNNNSNTVSNAKIKNEINMVIETDDDEEEEGGAIPATNSQFIRNSIGNSTEKQNKTSNIPPTKLDETLAKYQSFIQQSSSLHDEKNKQEQISNKGQDVSQKEQNESQSKQLQITNKGQSSSIKKQQSQEQKQIISSNNDQLKQIRSKQSSLIVNQQQVIEEEDDNSDIDQNSSPINSSAIKVEEDSQNIDYNNRLNNDSSLAKIINNDNNNDKSDSENNKNKINNNSNSNNNQRQTRASKRKQISKPKNKDNKLSKNQRSNSNVANPLTGIIQSTSSTTTNTTTVAAIKRGRVTRLRTQNIKSKNNNNKSKNNSTSPNASSSNKQHNFLRTRSTVKSTKDQTTISVKNNIQEATNDFPSIRTRKGSLRPNQQQNNFYSESSISRTSPHTSHSNQIFFCQEQMLNLDDEFNQLFSHLQSMSSLDFSDTSKILEDIISKIKNQQPKVENIIGILGSDNGKMLVCAKNLLFTDPLFSITNTTSKVNELKEELDTLIDTLQDLLKKRFFDHEEKLKILKTVNCNSNKNREIQEFDKDIQKISPLSKKKDIDNLSHQTSSSSSSSVRPRKQSTSQQLKEMSVNQTQQFQLQQKDQSEMNIGSSNTEREPVKVKEQSLVSFIQMQTEASLNKLTQNLVTADQTIVLSEKITSCIDQTNVNHSSYALNNSFSYSLVNSESLQSRYMRIQHSSEQSFNDKIIDEQAEGKCDKENNINNLTEEQKLMRRKICLKIIKPLNKILKDQAQAQSYAKNIEIMIRQKYPTMCAEYKNICKNLITLINQTDFDTSAQKIEEYLISSTPDRIRTLCLSCMDSLSNYNGDRDNQTFTSEPLKHAVVQLNDESNNSQHTNRTPKSRKFSTLSNKMDEEDNMIARYENSSESSANHDANNQSQSGDDKAAIFEEYSSNHQPSINNHPNKVIVDEEEDEEEEVQISIPKKFIPSPSNQSSAQENVIDDDSLLVPVECKIQSIQTEEKSRKQSVEKMEEEEVNYIGESQSIQSVVETHAAFLPTFYDEKKEEKHEEQDQGNSCKEEQEIISPQKNQNNEDSTKIQEEDDDEEEEVEMGNNCTYFQKSSQKEDFSHENNTVDEKNSLAVEQTESQIYQNAANNINSDSQEAVQQEQLQDIQSLSSKPNSAVKDQIEEIEIENALSCPQKQSSDPSSSSSQSPNQGEQLQNKVDENKDAIELENETETEQENKDMNESSTTPLICRNMLNTATSPSLLTEQ